MSDNYRPWKQEKMIYMKQLFGGKKLEKYQAEMNERPEGCGDDRQVYINVYNMIMNALETLPDEPDLYVKVAVDKEISTDCEMLKRINLHFLGRKY